jgi:hypothetical protein
MPWLKLCSGDELVDTLTDVFNANIVRVPEARIQPLAVVASRRGKSSFRGELPPLLASPITPPSVQTSRMADLSGKRSRRVKLDLGLDILDGFLRGFGVPGAALRQQFEGAAEVSFTFREVERRFVDVNELGQALKNSRIAPDNPAAAIFFGYQPYDFLLVDSAITSREFTIQVEHKQNADFKLDIPAIQDLVAKASASVAVASSAGLDLSFKGPQALGFAFTCLRFALGEDGRILALPPDQALTRAFGHAEPAGGRVRLSLEPALLEWED